MKITVEILRKNVSQSSGPVPGVSSFTCFFFLSTVGTFFNFFFFIHSGNIHRKLLPVAGLWLVDGIFALTNNLAGVANDVGRIPFSFSSVVKSCLRSSSLCLHWSHDVCVIDLLRTASSGPCGGNSTSVCPALTSSLYVVLSGWWFIAQMQNLHTDLSLRLWQKT